MDACITMVNVRFVHCADLHLDTPFRGLADVVPEVAAELNEATFKSYDNIIDLAIQEQVDFVVIAGDIFNSKDRSLRAQFRFRDGLKRLADHGIQSFVAFGNHDPLSGWSHTLEWPELAHRFGGKGVDVCEVVRGGQVVATVHGISFAREAVTEDLASQFSAPGDGVPAIAVLHSNVGGQPGHDNYAPTTVEALSSKGFDYWALGHVHMHRVLREAGPAIVYPGCSQSRQPNETGAKGCCVVTLGDDTRPDIRFVPTDTVRYYKGVANIDNCESIDAIQRTVVEACRIASEESEGRRLVARLSLLGRTALHGELTHGSALRDLFESTRDDLSSRDPWTWLEKLSLATRGLYNVEELQEQQDFAGDIVRAYSVLLSGENGEAVQLQQQLESEMLSSSVGKLLVPLEAEEFRQLVEQAMHQTLDRVVEEG